MEADCGSVFTKKLIAVTNYGGRSAALLQRIQNQMLDNSDPELIQKLKDIKGTVDKLSIVLHQLKNPSAVVVLLSLHYVLLQLLVIH